MKHPAYTDLKAGWHSGRIESLKAGEQIVPPHIQLIICDLCNQDCHFCSYRSEAGFSSEQYGEKQPDGSILMNPRFMSYEKATEILRDAARLGVRAVQFTGGGEPTVHPRHLELFRYAINLGLECALVSNGVIARDGILDTLPQFAWVRISLDAGSGPTYAATRRTPESNFVKALANTRELTARIAAEKSACVVGIGYVVTTHNFGEIVEGCRLAKETGASYIRLSAVFSREFVGPYLGIYARIKNSIDEARTMHESDTFKIVDLFGDRISDLDQHAPDYKTCGYQQFNMYIGADLKVYRCCTTSYTKHGEVGDLSQQSFQRWFLSDQKHAAYAGFDARSCQVCQFNDKNRTINYLTEKAPMHVNFV